MTHPNNEKLEQSCKVLHLQCTYLAGPIFFFGTNSYRFLERRQLAGVAHIPPGNNLPLSPLK